MRREIVWCYVLPRVAEIFRNLGLLIPTVEGHGLLWFSRLQDWDPCDPIGREDTHPDYPDDAVVRDASVGELVAEYGTLFRFGVYADRLMDFPTLIERGILRRADAREMDVWPEGCGPRYDWLGTDERMDIGDVVRIERYSAASGQWERVYGDSTQADWVLNSIQASALPMLHPVPHSPEADALGCKCKVVTGGRGDGRVLYSLHGRCPAHSQAQLTLHTPAGYPPDM